MRCAGNIYIGDAVFRSMFFYVPKKVAVLAVLFVCFAANNSYAQLDFLKDGYEEKYFNHDEGPGVEKNSAFSDKDITQYVYEEANVKNLSHLLWALTLYKPTNDWAVDEYMRVNECMLYQKYYEDDFEWDKIRNATRLFIKGNLHEFPTRFSFMMPLKLKDYNEKRKTFEIQDKYKIEAIRRFELYASDIAKKGCMKSHNLRKGYPRILHLEFSRPFNLIAIPMEMTKAHEYIKDKNKEYNKLYTGSRKSDDAKYKVRSAYLVINVKIFSHGKVGENRMRFLPTVQVMGILESYEVYVDKGRSDLLFKHSYVSGRKSGKLNLFLKDQYKVLREMSAGDGTMH